MERMTVGDGFRLKWGSTLAEWTKSILFGFPVLALTLIVGGIVLFIPALMGKNEEKKEQDGEAE